MKFLSRNFEKKWSYIIFSYFIKEYFYNLNMWPLSNMIITYYVKTFFLISNSLLNGKFYNLFLYSNPIKILWYIN